MNKDAGLQTGINTNGLRALCRKRTFISENRTMRGIQ